MPVLPDPPAYAAQPVVTGEGLVDVRLERQGRIWHLAGRGGPKAERSRVLAALTPPETKVLPVLVGAGLGTGLAAVREAGVGPVYVLDREAGIAAATGVRQAFAADPDVRFVDDADPDRAAAAVVDAARQAGFARLAVVIHPVYQRLDPAWYGAVAARLAGYDALRERLCRPRFTGSRPRVLLLRRPYFLYREIEAALTRLEVPFERLDTGTGERGETGVVEALLSTVARFGPDFALTVNHLGLDREGKLAGLLADIGLPLASWFVDSPRLILHDYSGLATPLTMVFSYDADALPELGAMGYTRTAWLPLATDPELFRPGVSLPAGHPWGARVSFVGASMEVQAAEALDRLPGDTPLRRWLPEAAAAFAASPQREARRFLTDRPDLAQAYAALPGSADRLNAELALTWEATRRYRQDCVRQLLPFGPAIAGDAGWRRVLPGAGKAWRELGALDYYLDLPGFYPASEVNFNCTSLQMKGAVNQRVFDVPACGGFVLTDAREQLSRLFEPERETAVYAAVAEIPDRLRHYLDHPAERRRITAAARQRILARHTYAHRLETVCATMGRMFGSASAWPAAAPNPWE